MPSILTVFLTIVLVYFLHAVYSFLKNYFDALKSGVPNLIFIPWDQNGFPWIVISVPLRPFLQKILPGCIFRKVDLTIYGHEFHQKHAHHQRSGGSYVLVTPGSFEFVTKDPEVSVEILRRVRDFQSHRLTHLFMSRFGGNVLASDGEDWGRMRRIVAPVINERVSERVFEESGRQTEGLLREVEGGQTNRLFDMMKRITVNVLSGAGMGASVAWEEDEDGKGGNEGERMSYMQAVKAVIEGVAGPIILPVWLLKNWPSFLPGQAYLNSLGVAIQEFPKQTHDLLEKERQRMKYTGGETRSNIMSQLLQANETGGKAGLSEDEMVGNLFIFTAAGFDTTANTLSYALVLLCRYPEWQDWLFEEIDRIFHGGPSAELDYTSLFPQATRVQAFMLETLRVFPPVIHLTKQTRSPQTITVSSGTYHIPANATVYVNTVATHLNPEVWRNLNHQPHESPAPDDEFAFRPSRWLDDQGMLFCPPKGTFVPWSTGPRVCPGQKMAQVEFTSIFLKLLRKNRIEAVPLFEGESKGQIERRLDAEMEDSISILTLQMRNVYNRKEGDGKGIQVRLKRRK